VVDTGLPSPAEVQPAPGPTYLVQPHAAIVLLAPAR
jgi:hypothetical protein